MAGDPRKLTADEIEAEAAVWIARADRGLNKDEQVAFETWRSADLRHHLAWLRLSTAWSKAERLIVLKEPVPKRRRITRGRRPSSVASFSSLITRKTQNLHVIAAAFVGCICILGASNFVADMMLGEQIATPVGGRTSVPLKDGSRVEVNTESKIRVSINSHQRRVWIDHGEAYFDVAPNPAMPFVIRAGEREVTVVGTRFSVRRQDDSVIVRVADGRVDVRNQLKGDLIQALPGDEVDINKRLVKKIHRGVDQIEDQMSWRSGRLVFQNMTLADIAAEFNRYNRRKLIIANSEVGAIRMGGAFLTSNIDGFTSLLDGSYGLKIEARRDEIIISH